MRIAPPELLARKTSLADNSSEDDARREKAQFDLALSGLRDTRTSTETSGDRDDGMHSGHGDMRRRRHASDDCLEAFNEDQGLSDDQLLSATDNNPVLAAFAAARGPWQTAYGSGNGSVPMRSSSDGAASSNRRVDVSLTVPATDSRIISRTSTAPHAHDPALVAHSYKAARQAAEPLSTEAETALIAAQNTGSAPQAPVANGASTEAPTGANPPSLPMPMAQRLVDGTVAALRIDRDTANPQNSASIIEVRHPELGVVKVQVQLRGDAMELRFEAAGNVVAMLRASESVLRKAVSQHGLRLRNLQVMDRSTLMQERSRRARRHLLDLEA